ncbi:beta-L-arabinobiosidase-like [Oppia nitens]|uniref:beta-L-arabinobiosidase-like n=1 Tax=Oppia nitens TaxID=1686743 RepID=UPI0023DA4777|nr:beta-L-arabinobiosidase-like [Oppia nitens]
MDLMSFTCIYLMSCLILDRQVDNYENKWCPAYCRCFEAIKDGFGPKTSYSVVCDSYGERMTNLYDLQPLKGKVINSLVLEGLRFIHLYTTFEDLSVKNLVISHCDFRYYITDKSHIFDGLDYEYLEVLTILRNTVVGNQYEELEWKMFYKFTNLKAIYIENSNLYYLAKNFRDMTCAPSVKILTLKNNMLTTVARDALENFSNLKISLYALNNNNNNNFIDRSSKVSQFAEKQWFLDNIPFIDIPDKNIEDVYYYRWSSHKRHLRYIIGGTGYMTTEFVNDVGYSQKFGVINAAGGHQIYESRWLRDTRYVKDYINIYARQLNKAANNQYSEWITESAYNTYLVNGDKDFITSQLDGFVKIYNDWLDHYEPKLGLYYISPVWDAQEYSAASVQTKDPFGGGIGYRPSHNSEMFGNAQTIVRIAQLAGNKDIEKDFQTKGENLRKAILTHLWDSKRQFFYHMQRENNPNNELLDTREEVGLYPWRYGVPDNQFNYSLALNQLYDQQGMGTEYGPSTCETRSKWYDGKQKHQCCWWNGNSWPYSTAHVLRSVATHIRKYSHQNPNINIDKYIQLLKAYTMTQYKNGKPYVAECHSPVGDFWVGDSFNHSEHYAHSTYTDNVLTELLGILPQEDNTIIIDPLVPKSWSYFALENLLYHGKNISIVYDSTGNKYKVGKGMTVYVNGISVYHKEGLEKAVIDVGDYTHEPISSRMENYAVNINRNGYPRPYASFTDNSPGDTWQAVDGRVFYDYVPSNRWSNFNSKHETDWFAVDFGRDKTVNSVNVYVYSDVVTHEGRTDCPTKMVIQYYTANNEWKDVDNQMSYPSQCSPNDKNIITFKAIKTSQIRVVFTRNVGKDYYVGITELEVWAKWPQTSSPNIYEAEDGMVYNALIERSSTASGQSYVGLIDKKDSAVEFSGVYVSKTKDYKLRVFYANAENQDSTHHLVVNNLHTLAVAYKPSGAGWGHFSDNTYVDLTVPLLYGNNVLRFEYSVNHSELDKIQLLD